jgi:5-methylcytosine-specific restriction endonuclease McrA
MSAPKDPIKRAEWIAKISKGKKGSVSPNKGKKFTKEWKENLSKAHKGLKLSDKAKANLLYYTTGKNSFNYIDGRSKDPKWRSWIKNKRGYLKRLKRNSTIGSHTFGEWETLKIQYNFTCPRCDKTEPEISLTRDHIVPLSKGGSDNIENIQPLCLKCNLWKHTKIINFTNKFAGNDESL